MLRPAGDPLHGRYRLTWREPAPARGGGHRLRHRSVGCVDREAALVAARSATPFGGELRLIDGVVGDAVITTLSAIAVWAFEGGDELAIRLPARLQDAQWGADIVAVAGRAAAQVALEVAIARGVEAGLFDEAQGAALMSALAITVQSLEPLPASPVGRF